MSDSSLQIEASELCTAELKSNFRKYILGSDYCLYLTNHSDQIINAWIKVQIFKAKIFNTSLCDEFDCNQLSFLLKMILTTMIIHSCKILFSKHSVCFLKMDAARMGTSTRNTLSQR